MHLQPNPRHDAADPKHENARGRLTRRLLGAAMVAAVAVALALPRGAGAQETDRGEALGPRVNAQEMLSAQFARSALAVLRQPGNAKPRSDQYIRAKILLDLAVGLAPRDPQLRQLEAELASRTDDPAQQRKALLAYLKLAPDDDAAQLKLVTLGLDSLSTLDQRLDKVARVLHAPAAGDLSKPLRSRLASYAAAAAHEIGDAKTYQHWLSVAARADPTNARAAAMVVRLAREHHAAPTLLGAALVNRIKASPMASGPRLALADLLLEQAAFSDAAKQYQAAANLKGGPLSPGRYRHWLHALACAGRLSDAVSLADQLDTLIQQGKAAADKAAARGADHAKTAKPTKPAKGEPAGRPSMGQPKNGAQDAGSTLHARPVHPKDEASSKPGGANAENDGRPGSPGSANSADSGSPTGSASPTPSGPSALPMDLRIKRAIILSMNGEQSRVRSLLKPLRQALRARAKSGDASASLDLASLLLVLDRDSDTVASLLSRAPKSPRREALRGLLAAGEGKKKQAAKLLQPLADSHPAAAYGQALLSAANQAGRAPAMARLARRMPLSVFGMTAAIVADQAGRPVSPTGVGASLLQNMDRQPSRLWNMNLSDHPWIQIDVTARPTRFGYLEPIPLKLTIRNTTRLPVSLGPGRTVPTRVFLSVSPSVRGRVLGTLPPIVADMGRRLTLGPHQSLSRTVRLDRSNFGGFIASRPFTTLRFNATAILDPRTGRHGAVVPGPLGARETALSLQAWSLSPSKENIKAWIKGLQSDDDAHQLQSIAWLVALHPEAKKAPIDAADAQRIGKRIAAAYKTYGPVRRAWTIARAAQPDNAQATLAPIYARAKKSDQPMVRIAYLLAHVHSPQDPALAQAAKSGNTQVRRFALALRAGLKQAAKAKQKNKANPGGSGQTGS